MNEPHALTAHPDTLDGRGADYMTREALLRFDLFEEAAEYADRAGLPLSALDQDDRGRWVVRLDAGSTDAALFHLIAAEGFSA